MYVQNSPELTNSNYSIERPEINDAVEIINMHNKSWLDTYPNKEYGISQGYIEDMISNRLTPKGVAQRRDNIQRSYDDPTYFLRIAKDSKGDIVGFIDGFFEDDKYELAGLYTARHTHGTGLAIDLWHSYQTWADPAKSIWLTVVTYNHRARGFYRKIGFAELPETERSYGESHIPIIDMERKIST